MAVQQQAGLQELHTGSSLRGGFRGAETFRSTHARPRLTEALSEQSLQRVAGEATVDPTGCLGQAVLQVAGIWVASSAISLSEHMWSSAMRSCCDASAQRGIDVSRPRSACSNPGGHSRGPPHLQVLPGHGSQRRGRPRGVRTLVAMALLHLLSLD